MAKNTYKLCYLPVFFDDIMNAASYIRNSLHSSVTADELVNEIEKAIEERLPDCESFEPYKSKRDRKNTYYRIYVKRYVIYYVVIDDGKGKTMEVRRLLHQLQDREKIV